MSHQTLTEETSLVLRQPQDVIELDFEAFDDIYTDVLNKTGITPCGYNLLVVIVKSEVAEKMEKSGLIMPENFESQRVTANIIGKVLQLGAGCYTDKNRTPGPPWCLPGDYVVLPPYSGMRMKSTLEEYKNGAIRIVTEDSIIATVADQTVLERF